ncbi:MAG: nuclease A inhibitor family protein [Gemmatimonadaceae bacterium]|nr:nuclease A inhibitor family protein [Gemmatimonadaceae bacterium]
MTRTAQLHEAIAGLTYTSESDRPFIVVRVRDPDPAHALDASYLRRVLRVDPETPLELRTIDDTLARHTHRTDPYDVATQRIRPRYEALQRLLESTLRDAVAVRVGRVEVAVWLLGRAPEGGLVGVRTTAIET